MGRTQFTELPTEILEAIILLLDPASVISLSKTNKLSKKLTIDAPLVWRNLCQTQFESWDARHNISAKFAGPLSDVDWRSLYIQRIKVQHRTRALLNHVLNTQQERTKCINEIAEFGYDAKETLLEEYACSDHAEDVLARRYYAKAVIERMSRETAINTWKKLRDADDMPLEEALGAYDVFVRVGDDVGIDVISHELDQLAAALLHQHCGFSSLSPRLKAATLATFLREQGFQGVSMTAYRALQNSFIGIVLGKGSHESLPLISVAIYCAVARRVGLDARPCGFLFHVYTLVYAPANYNLDGIYKPTSSSKLDFLYLDPFRSSEEVQQADLIRTLRDMGVPSVDHETYLSDTTTREMVLRTARNIVNSVQTIRQTEAGRPQITPRWTEINPDMDNAFYASIWAMLILTPADNTIQRRQYLPYLLEHSQTHFPWDIGMLEEHVIPMFWHSPEGERLLEFARQMHQVDSIPKQPIARDQTTVDVKFKVGQLFQHRRYNYEGVITGWDTNCDAGEDWIASNGVDRVLANGRNQSFYHVLVCDKSVRYVAEENIEPLDNDAGPSDAMLRLAGRHFKRWDDEKRVFVSNVRDEYPDD